MSSLESAIFISVIFATLVIGGKTNDVFYKKSIQITKEFRESKNKYRIKSEGFNKTRTFESVKDLFNGDSFDKYLSSHDLNAD